MQAKRGTPCYMAPELFQDGSTHSSAADLWALGCVLYECAAGHPPFVSTSFNHLVNDILTSSPAALPSKLPRTAKVRLLNCRQYAISAVCGVRDPDTQPQVSQALRRCSAIVHKQRLLPSGTNPGFQDLVVADTLTHCSHWLRKSIDTVR